MNWLIKLIWTLLYIVLVFEKSRQFWANIFGNTICRSFLKKGNFIHAFELLKLIFISCNFLKKSPPTERHCHKHCQQQRSQEECLRRGCPRQSPMDFPVKCQFYFWVDVLILMTGIIGGWM